MHSFSALRVCYIIIICTVCSLTNPVGHGLVYLIFVANIAGNIRNLAMEKVAGSVLFPCRYVSNGCNATMPHTDKSSHEDGCEFRLGCSHFCCVHLY